MGYVNLYLTKLIKYDKSCRALDAPLFQCLCVCFSAREKATCPLSFSKHTSVQLTGGTSSIIVNVTPCTDTARHNLGGLSNYAVKAYCKRKLTLLMELADYASCPLKKTKT